MTAIKRTQFPRTKPPTLPQSYDRLSATVELSRDKLPEWWATFGLFSDGFHRRRFPTRFVKLVRTTHTVNTLPAALSLPVFPRIVASLFHPNFPIPCNSRQIFIIALRAKLLRAVDEGCEILHQTVGQHRVLIINYDTMQRNVIIGFHNAVIFFVNETEWIGFATNYIFNRLNL